jgi:hypothetical protein
MRIASQKRTLLVLFAGLLGAAERGALALEHELRVAAAGAGDVGGALEASTTGMWLGAEAGYAVRVLGPLWLHAGLDAAAASGRSAGSASPLDLRRWSARAGAGVRWPLGRRLELGLEAEAGTGRLREDFRPIGGAGPIRTTVSGTALSVSATASLALYRRWRLPLKLCLGRLVYDGPIEAIDSTQLGLSAGLALRLGKARGR